MGKACNQNDLTDYYLRAAGVAAKVDEQPGRIIYCCLRGDHFRLGYHLYEWNQAVRASPEAIARKLEKMATGLAIGLAKHHTAVERRAAVAALEGAFETIAQRGEMREINTAFKAASVVEPSLRYPNFIATKEVAAIDELARRANGS